MITVAIETDSMGNVLVAPVSERWRARFRKCVTDNGGPNSAYAFFNEGAAASEFLAELPARKRRELERGYTVHMRADPWIVGHWYGYDAHTAAE